MKRPPVSVVVPTRDRPELLARCLESVGAALRPDDDLVVVDSASADPQVAVTAAAAGARVIRCDRPGVDRARNAGWRAAVHDAVLFVDDDVVVDRAWADALAEALADAAFVTGRIDVPSHQAGTARPVAIKDDDEPAVLDATTTGTLGHSASLAIWRAALERVGGFDESLGAGARFQSAPEVDLFDRLFAAGLAGRYEPRARAWHEQWRTPREKVHLDWRYGLGTGARVVKLLHSDRRRALTVARDAAWDRGVRRAVDDLRHGYRLGAATALARTAGVVVGAVRAAPVRVRDGHFVERRR